MLAFLPAPLLGTIVGVAIVCSTVFWCTPLYLGILVKVLVPNDRFRRACTDGLIVIAGLWIRSNDLILRLTPPIQFQVSGLEQLPPGRSYLLIANHQSWTDVVVIQHLLQGRLPFPRYFSKRELLKLPLIGFAIWGLDFPLMHRYSRAETEQNPELRRKDLEITRAACERYRGRPVTIVNFLEGTRFRPHKHAAQGSPYAHLLRPKAGGVAYALSAMGEQFDAILDMTIVYGDGKSGFDDLICGRVRTIVVDCRRREIPGQWLGRDYLQDEAFKEGIRAWVGEVWREKDELIERVREREMTHLN